MAAASEGLDGETSGEDTMIIAVTPPRSNPAIELVDAVAKLKGKGPALPPTAQVPAKRKLKDLSSGGSTSALNPIQVQWPFLILCTYY